jgi:hypothetical protein
MAEVTAVVVAVTPVVSAEAVFLAATSAVSADTLVSDTRVSGIPVGIQAWGAPVTVFTRIRDRVPA